MKFAAVDSSTLAVVAYDSATWLLQLEFRSRAIYEYSGVPAVVYEALLCASSKGEYFNRAIRGRFPYRRVPSSKSDGPGAAHLRRPR